MKALILVNLQNDFCALGTVEVPGAEEVIPLANQLMPHFDLVVASKDWHPGNHLSFAANHLWRYPGQTMDIKGKAQLLWPIHGVKDSFGAEFNFQLNQQKIDHIVYQGTDPNIDGSSAFFDDDPAKSTGLDVWLKARKVKEVYTMGLAAEHAVKNTALDALRLGYQSFLLEDACRAYSAQPEVWIQASQAMIKAGVKRVSLSTFLENDNSQGR